MTKRRVLTGLDTRCTGPSRRSHALDATDSIAGRAQPLDTLELRWITPGSLPTEIVDWFTDRGRTGAVEQRCDTYRLDERADLGVKFRFRVLPEFKECLAAESIAQEDLRLAGRLETWRKWSPAELLVDAADDRWIEVDKTITRRRFRADGQEIPITEPSTLATGTDVEIVAVTMGEVEVWSFAFAAHGPASGRRAALAACCQAVLASTPPPSLVLSASSSASYPGWLAAIAAPSDLATA